MNKKKVYLDDVRATPEGWHRTFNIQDTIKLIDNEEAEIISLDNDLGELTIINGEEGWHVLQWLEEKVFNNPDFFVPEIRIHTDNIVARKRMEQIIKSIERFKSRS